MVFTFLLLSFAAMMRGGGGRVMRGPLDEVGLFSDFLKFFECLKLLDRLSLLLDRNWRSRSSR